MTDLNRRLQDMFAFKEFDVRANRAGRMSQRQRALLQAAGRNVTLSFVLFTFIMLGSLGFIAFMLVQSGSASPAQLLSDPDSLTTLMAASAVVILVIGIGAVISRRYVANLGAKHFSVARGAAAVASKAEGNWQIRIGVTRLRMPTEEHMRAFQPGTEYRVYYLPGAMPMVLSAEVASGEADAGLPPLTQAEEAELARQDPQVQSAGHAWLLLAMLGVLVVFIPIAGVLVSSLPALQRVTVMVGLLVIAGVYALLSPRLVAPRRQ
jgi:hypothetical protein